MAEHEISEEDAARFEDFTVLQAEFDDVEVEIIRKADALHAPLYKKRAEIAAKTPHFWTTVFEQAPPEIDNYILPTDAQVFTECLDTFEVSRFEIDDPKGSPRSFSLKFGFKENQYFEDTVLEKKFWYRESDQWAGLVSEPVKIHWKKDKDLTGGLTDAAYELGQARKKLGKDSSDAAARKEEAKLPEYQKLAREVAESSEESISFFGIFAFVSGYRWIGVEESQRRIQHMKEQHEKMRSGNYVPDDDDDEEEDDSMDYQEVEVFPGGDEVVSIIAEDMWPNALKYWKSSFEMEADDEDLSDMELSDVDGMDQFASDSDDDEDMKPVDIRALVGKGSKSDKPPPAKKQRQK